MQMPWLTLIGLIPLVGAVVALLPVTSPSSSRDVALGVLAVRIS